MVGFAVVIPKVPGFVSGIVGFFTPGTPNFLAAVGFCRVLIVPPRNGVAHGSELWVMTFIILLYPRVPTSLSSTFVPNL